MRKKLVGIRDLIFICCLLFASLLLLLLVSSHTDSCVAIIEQNGIPVREIDLAYITEPEEIDLGGPYHVGFHLRPGGIAFSASDCPDKTCIRTGWLTKPGQSAVCLPARVSIRLIGSDSQIDAITG